MSICLDSQGYKIHNHANSSRDDLEVYEDIAKMIYEMCWKFQRKHGGDFQEYLSAANEGYAIANSSFTAGRSQFITWVYHQVRGALHNYVNDESRFHVRTRSNSIHGHENDLPRDIPDRPSKSINKILSELSSDGRTVVELIISCPGELAEVLRPRQPLQSRQALRKYLKRGWSWARIIDAFTEVQQVLYSQ